MALMHGSEYFTKWTHVENGQVLSRRLHRMEVQARNGRLYVIQGPSLPDYIQTCAGHGYRGHHVAQILLSPERHDRLAKWSYGMELEKLRSLWRDVVCAFVGFAAAVLLRFVTTASF